MRSDAGEFLRNERLRHGLTLQDLARRIGYRNANKGARRIEELETSGRGTRTLVDSVAIVLSVGDRVRTLAARDEEARSASFAAWLEEPQPMRLLQLVCGATLEVLLPPGLSDEEAIVHARSVHRDRPFRTCLVLSRKRSFWIDRDGREWFTEASLDRPNFPYTTLG